MTEIVHDLNAKKCGCDACQARRAARTAAARAAAVGAAHPADCRCRPCTSRRRKLAQAALVGTPAIANQPSAPSPAGSSPTAGEDGAGQGDSVVTEQALLDMINKGVNDTLIVEDAVKDKPRSPVPVYQGMPAEKGNLERDSVGKPVSGAIKTTQTAGGNEAPVGDELPPQCTTCGRFKVPVGYPEPEQFCGPTSCPGYAEAPAPETEWPLERQASAKDAQARREHAVLVEQRQAIRNAIILEDDRTMAEHWGDGRDAWQREDLEALDRYETRHALLSRPRGHSKTGDAGSEAMVELLTGKDKVLLCYSADEEQARCCSMT